MYYVEGSVCCIYTICAGGITQTDRCEGERVIAIEEAELWSSAKAERARAGGGVVVFGSH